MSVDAQQEIVEAEVQKMRQKMKEKTKGLTCSAGIGPNRMIAKIASDLNKPDGQYFVPFNKEGILEFVKDLPGL
jgi:DNA polymerase kappa